MLHEANAVQRGDDRRHDFGVTVGKRKAARIGRVEVESVVGALVEDHLRRPRGDLGDPRAVDLRHDHDIVLGDREAGRPLQLGEGPVYRPRPVVRADATRDPRGQRRGLAPVTLARPAEHGHFVPAPAVTEAAVLVDDVGVETVPAQDGGVPVDGSDSSEGHFVVGAEKVDRHEVVISERASAKLAPVTWTISRQAPYSPPHSPAPPRRVTPASLNLS